jgi:hypothetical protein
MDVGPELLARLPALTSPLGLAAVAAVLLIGLFITEKFLSVPYPEGIPLIREPKGAKRFSLRTRWLYLTDCKSLFHEAYQDVRILLAFELMMLTYYSTSRKASQSSFQVLASE